jgi:hypothetical protein
MSLPLKDFRGKITVETDCALEAEAQATGKDKQEILREVMHGWARRRIDEANVLHRLLRSEGLIGPDEGIERNPRR